MNIGHAIASAKVRKFASPHRNSCRSSVSAARCLILVSIGNLACSCVSLLPDNLRGGLGPPPSNRKELLASGRYGSGDLVERRVSDVKGFNLRRSLNYRGEELRHFWVSSAVVSLGILRLSHKLIPNASVPPWPTNVISSRNPCCFRSRGRMSFSSLWVNSATLLGFRCI